MTNETNENTYDKSDVINTPLTMEVVVTNITIKLGKDIFINKEGVVVTDEPNQEFLNLRLENAEWDFNREYHIAKMPKGKVPDNSNLGLFLDKYGKLETGMKLVVMKNSAGFYDLMYK